MHIIVELEGVLKDTKGSPINSGIILIAQLAAYNKLTFVTEMSRPEAEQWINVNKVVDYDHLLDSSVGLVGDELILRQINYARAQGAIDLFVTNNPTHWAKAFEQGITCVLFSVPSYTRPEFRPDAPRRARSWTDIEAAIEKQNELRTKDARMTRAEGVKFE
jgi:hypothetical protein